jgi:hypothetical protein
MLVGHEVPATMEEMRQMEEEAERPFPKRLRTALGQDEHGKLRKKLYIESPEQTKLRKRSPKAVGV